MNLLECEYYKASGHCLDGTFNGVGVDVYGTEECRKCVFSQCLNDIASNLSEDMHKLIDKFDEETYQVVKDFIKKERKAIEKK